MTSGRPLAEELREVYPDTVNKVVDLFVRITADEKALSALHQARPPGVMEHLLSAELHARGTRSLHSRHAVASNFGVLVRLEQRPPNLAPAAAANGCGVRHIHGASVRPRRLGKQLRAARRGAAAGATV